MKINVGNWIVEATEDATGNLTICIVGGDRFIGENIEKLTYWKGDPDLVRCLTKEREGNHAKS